MAVSFRNCRQDGVRNNRQSNNKIIMNGDVILMVFPPFATEEKYGYLIIGQANTSQPTTKFKPKMRTK